MSKLIVSPNSDFQMETAVQETLKEVLNDPTINKHFGGSDEKLSSAQAGLAAAVTVKMQQRLIENIQQSHQRELSLISGFWRLYKTQMFQRPTDHTDPISETKNAKAHRGSQLAELFTWGNVLGGAAVVIVALAFYFTKVTESYKDHWANAEKDAAVLREQYSAELKVNEAQETELGKARERADVAEATIKSIATLSADQQQQFTRIVNELSEQRGALAKEVASSTSEKRFQKLYENAATELTKLSEKDANCPSSAK
jgi:hypothetical protein